MMYIIGLNLINIKFEIKLNIHKYLKAKKKDYYKVMTEYCKDF